MFRAQSDFINALCDYGMVSFFSCGAAPIDVTEAAQSRQADPSIARFLCCGAFHCFRALESGGGSCVAVLRWSSQEMR
eukprot:1180479-Rhodomonas_salina.1